MKDESDFFLNRIPVVWLIGGLAVIVFLCVLGLMAAVLLAVTGRGQNEAVALPPPPTNTAEPSAGPTVSAVATLLPAATVTLPGDETGSGRVTAVRFESPPTIDGVLDEWGSAAPFTTPHIAEQKASWNGTMDIEARWRAGWDDEFLYLGTAIADDVHVQINETKFAYLGDSIELQFDTNRDADFGPTVNSDDFQYVVSPGDFSSRPAGAFRFRGDNAGRMTDFLATNAIIMSTKTGDGYVLEAAIPWSDLNMSPAAGLIMGAAFSTNDLDTAGTSVQELMLSNVPGRRWLDPSSWGTLELMP